MEDRTRRLLHELEVHRDELTIENDALRTAQADLEASRDRYAELYELGPVGHMDLDREGRILSINATGASILGVSQVDVGGIPFTTFVEQMEIQKYFGFLRRCLKENAKVEARITLRARGGSGSRRVRAQFASVAVRQTARTILRTAFFDISRQEEEEQEEKVRAKRAAQTNDFSLVAMSRVDLSEIAAAAAMLAARVLGASFVEILELLPEGRGLRTVAAAGRMGHAATKDVSASDSPYDQAIRTRRPVLFEDRPPDAVSRAPHLVQARIASGVAVLVPADPSRPYGVLGVYSAIRRAYDLADLQFLQSVANMLGTAVANRRMEAALRESEERFRLLVANSMVGIFIVQEGKVVFMNPEQERIFGKIPVPFELEELGPLVHPEDRENLRYLRRTDDPSRKYGEDISFRFLPRGRAEGSGEFVWTNCRAAPIRYRDREALLVNAVNVTRAKELEQIAAMSDKMASLGQLTAGIAHEIRNPLSGINIYLSSLEKLFDGLEELDGEKKEMARHIVASLTKNSDRVESVIRKVMDLSRPKAPRFVPSDLNRCIESAVDLSTINMRRSGIQIRKRLAGDLATVHADPQLLEQVLLNLLTNATQAVSRNSGRKEIEVSSAMESGRVVIRVGDSGPGVPESIREKIFNPFFTTKQEGIGIGLAFSHRVIAEHGGSLTVDTSPLGGAEFRIDLPLPAADPARKRGA